MVTISQSGETADTLASLRFAKKTDNPITLTICNVANSSMCRESDFTMLTNAFVNIVKSDSRHIELLATLHMVRVIGLSVFLANLKDAKVSAVSPD